MASSYKISSQFTVPFKSQDRRGLQEFIEGVAGNYGCQTAFQVLETLCDLARGAIEEGLEPTGDTFTQSYSDAQTGQAPATSSEDTFVAKLHESHLRKGWLSDFREHHVDQGRLDDGAILTHVIKNFFKEREGIRVPILLSPKYAHQLQELAEPAIEEQDATSVENFASKFMKDALVAHLKAQKQAATAPPQSSEPPPSPKPRRRGGFKIKLTP